MQSRITYNCTVTKLPQAEGNSESFKWLERSYHYIHRQQSETRDEQDKEAAEHRWRYPTHSNRYQVVIVTGVFPQDMTIYAKTSGRKHPNGVCFKAAVQTLRPMSPTDVYLKNVALDSSQKQDSMISTAKYPPSLNTAKSLFIALVILLLYYFYGHIKTLKNRRYTYLTQQSAQIC